MKFSFEVAKHKLIYILGAPDDLHRGLLKIGETTITTKIPAKNLTPNCPELNRAAIARIRQYMPTAGVPYKLLHTELAVDDKNEVFKDTDVHSVLTKSGIERGGEGNEWFRTDLKIARRAVDAVKHGKKFLAGIRPKDIREEIILRPEQETAVARTVAYFKSGGDRFLWNAKMRFGKTLCALEVVKRMNFPKTIIVTHRPVVKAGWFEDFDKIFGDNENFICARDAKDDTLAALKKARNNFVCFASIQDLRGSDSVGGKFDKNHEVFKVQWDFVIVDEAHEGTTTAIGDNVIKALVKRKTQFLALSGTPFNIRDDYGDDNVFTWDYVMEQRAKERWAELHPLDHNPYADLPAMNIFTYDLGELSKYVDAEDMSFSFREFFRTYGNEGNERFLHEQDVISFLNLLTIKGTGNYPFSTPEFCDMFKHTLWIVPGVKEGRALSALLKRHQVFCNFEIANVAGDGDEEIKYTDALKLVKDTIAANDYTITISCGKLTTGVTVPEWTAVLYLAGGYSTRASTYLQTIFRVQTPCNKYGVSKQNAYVFDFAPDRALRVVADSVKASTRAGMTTDDQRRALGELLNFCPVIAVKGSEMKDFDTAAKLLKRIKRVQAERIVNKGFEDPYLYNNTLFDIDDDEWKDFQQLGNFVAKSGSSKNTGIVVINDQGLTDEQREITTRKFYKPRTEKEKELDKKRRRRLGAIKALNGVSIRIPMLIYGANVDFDEDISVERFLEIVDDASWQEFMPKNVTKDFFRKFIRHYDIENFINAGHDVRERAKAADSLTPTERVNAIAALFATFKNPDKETVLTPWNVAKLHIDSVFDEKFFTVDKKILEINSKTGLYPLYVACKIYRARLKAHGCDEDKTPLKELRRLWDLGIANNVFALCKTPMAVTITRRTLIGYRRAVAHARHFDNLIDTLKTKPQDFFKRVTNAQFWDKGVGTMFFDAVVGNPPYQVAVEGSNKNSALPVYHEFLKASYNEKLTKRASLIHPARFLFNAGISLGNFPENFLQNKHIRIKRYFPDSTKYISDDGDEKPLFQTSDIKGGVAITEFDATKIFKPIGLFIPFKELRAIHQKVVVDNPDFKPFSEIIYSRTIYRLTDKVHEDFPDAASCLSYGHLYDMSTNIFALLPNIFFDEEPDDGEEYIELYGRFNNDRVCLWVRRDYVTDHESLTKWKVFVPDANGSGALGEVVSTPLVGHTETFITVGAFDTRAEADACIAYIKTKFCRALLGILKVTQHNPPQTWSKVPLQDFTSASDIDWSLSIPEIDEKLYDKYGLTAAERDFIESHVKAMT